MSNTYFQFKQFIVHQEKTSMKVCTDSCLFGAWVADCVSKESNTIDRVLDIGCGTGLLSLMFAQKNNSKIDAIEIDQDAAEQAQQNISLSPWKEGIRVSTIALQKYSPSEPFDLIISNPPFYENDLKSVNTLKNAAKHDTTLTLELLIHFITKHLSAQGKAAILLPFHRTQDLERLIITNDLFVSRKVLVRQTKKHDYFRTMFILSKIEQGECLENSISVRDESGNYSSDFIELLQDYYLAL